MFAALTATAVGAQEPESLEGARLLEVRSAGRQPLYKSFGEGCPTLRRRCREQAYLLDGDLVVADGPPANGFIAVKFTNRRGRTTLGLLPMTAVVPVTEHGPVDWTGVWRREEATVTVKPASAGQVQVEGLATWGGSDPERVRNGGVHTGEFGGKFDGRRRDAALAEDECRVRLRLLGPYLLVTDNLGCGGVNVTFTGVYRR